MPLLNICAITGNNKVIQVGVSFLSGEKQADYNWAICQVRQIMAKNTIEEPFSIVTDRELALIKCLDTQFPKSQHILCRWHVNMNVLAKTKKFFPGPVKDQEGKVVRHPQFQAFLSCWNTLLASSTEQAYNQLLEKMRADFPSGALSYIEGTWLWWKEKLVSFWVNQHLHFGVTVTSPIEGCHAILKSYLQTRNRDLRGVFVRMNHFWEAQQTGINTTIAQQRLRPKHHTNIPLFAAIFQHIHGYALEKILLEHAKLPLCRGPSTVDCNCSIQQSMGLPCFHTIWKRKQEGGVILLEDIHSHWYYDRPIQSTFLEDVITPPFSCLNPLRVKGKGRPRGALGGVSRVAESSTRRNPSSWELPSSSAPAILDRPRSPVEQLFIVHSRLSSTAIAMQRYKAGLVDEYEPGTQRERGYMQGLSSIYQTEYTGDATAIATTVIQRDVVGGVEVYTQDEEYEIDN